MTLDSRNYGIGQSVGNAGFTSSTVGAAVLGFDRVSGFRALGF